MKNSWNLLISSRVVPEIRDKACVCVSTAAGVVFQISKMVMVSVLAKEHGRFEHLCRTSCNR